MGKCPNCGAPTKENKCSYCGYEKDENISGHNIVVNVNLGSERLIDDTNKVSVEERKSNLFTTSEYSDKSKVVTLVLCIFLGYLGIHHFYAKKYVWGLIYFFTLGLFMIGYICDIVMILINKYKDGDGNYVIK